MTIVPPPAASYSHSNSLTTMAAPDYLSAQFTYIVASYGTGGHFYFEKKPLNFLEVKGYTQIELFRLTILCQIHSKTGKGSWTPKSAPLIRVKGHSQMEHLKLTIPYQFLSKTGKGSWTPKSTPLSEVKGHVQKLKDAQRTKLQQGNSSGNRPLYTDRAGLGAHCDPPQAEPRVLP